jgi:hypothetical protein
MLYARAADVVAVTHAAFIAFLLIGGFLAWRWPRLVWAHLPAVVVTAAVFAFGADCPLTDLEKYFRRHAGERAYRDGFIAHYLLPMVPDDVRTVAVPLFVVGVNAAVYAGYAARRRHASTGPGLTAAPRLPADGEDAPNDGSLPTRTVDGARGAHESRV